MDDQLSTSSFRARRPAVGTVYSGRMRDGIRSGLLVLTLAGAGVALGGCAGSGANLDGRTYTSTEVRGHDLVEGSQVTLTFEDGRLSAQAGCNTMSGEATWDDGTLEVAGPMASTMMACEQPLMDQDQWLSSFLASSPSLEADGRTLTLGDDSTRMTLAEQE
jgi:heat shock protein HslJ